MAAGGRAYAEMTTQTHLHRYKRHPILKGIGFIL